MKKVLVAMSGGVDSTVVAYLLQKEGYEIEGVYMKLHDNPLYHDNNIDKVKKVADFLHIPYHILDLSQRFNEAVFMPFVETYKEGLTPNPCVICNRNIKLGALLDFTKEKGFDTLATGHYAKIEDGFITEAKDASKDQSYFLSNVKKEALDSVIFPLGDMYKTEVKEIATGVEVLKEHTDIDLPGEAIDREGNIIGKHRGYMHYTIGKRKGFTLKVAHVPHYVLDINAEKNQITVGTKEELNVLGFKVAALNMFIKDSEFDASVKIRYRSPKVPCHVVIEDDMAIVTLKEHVQGLAPGQAAVFYQTNHVIGSGWIIEEIK